MMTDDRNDQSQYSTGWLAGRQITVAEMKLGQLLVEASIISPATLDAAIEIAAESHETIETVLLQKFHLPQQTLRSVDKASAMIDAQLVERSTALNALYSSHTSGQDFSDIIAQENGGAPELEHLLVQSKMVSVSHLKEAKRLGKERGMQIGASLFFMKVVSFTHLNYALDCLYMVKENRLSMSRAVIALAEVKLTNCNLQSALGAAPGANNHVKIGELLLSGRVVNEAEMLKNLEEAIASQRLIGALLVESGLVSESILKDVLMLQRFCAKGVLDQRSAVKILRKSIESAEDVTVSARTLNTFGDDTTLSETALDSLIKAGFVRQPDVEQAQSNFENLGMGPLRALVADGLICASGRRAALECAQLRLANVITEEEAVSVLHHCDRYNVGYEEAFQKLGISKLEDRRRNVDLAISSEFKKNKSLVPKLHRSFHFVLMLIVSFLTIVGTIILRNCDPCNLSAFGVTVLAVTASLVVLRIGKFWLLYAKRQVKENEERMDTARVTVARLKPQNRDVQRQPRLKEQISENTAATRV